MPGRIATARGTLPAAIHAGAWETRVPGEPDTLPKALEPRLLGRPHPDQAVRVLQRRLQTLHVAAREPDAIEKVVHLPQVQSLGSLEELEPLCVEVGVGVADGRRLARLRGPLGGPRRVRRADAIPDPSAVRSARADQRSPIAWREPRVPAHRRPGRRNETAAGRVAVDEERERHPRVKAAPIST